ncbi:MAG: hypothetical protein JXA74_02385 [Anaerolineae bacterium]|nr:hypothetical protein [Anaerolineae bacterium]
MSKRVLCVLIVLLFAVAVASVLADEPPSSTVYIACVHTGPTPPLVTPTPTEEASGERVVLEFEKLPDFDGIPILIHNQYAQPVTNVIIQWRSGSCDPIGGFCYSVDEPDVFVEGRIEPGETREVILHVSVGYRSFTSAKVTGILVTE